jgi:hypothetical protein
MHRDVAVECANRARDGLILSCSRRRLVTMGPRLTTGCLRTGPLFAGRQSPYVRDPLCSLLVHRNGEPGSCLRLRGRDGRGPKGGGAPGHQRGADSARLAPSLAAGSGVRHRQPALQMATGWCGTAPQRLLRWHQESDRRPAARGGRSGTRGGRGLPGPGPVSTPRSQPAAYWKDVVKTVHQFKENQLCRMGSLN